MSQEAVLFDDTVRANIAYGRLDASEQEIEAATRAAGADSFIQELPNGYDTMIGEHGVKLSGGQRQRLSIARAMLKDARSCCSTRRPAPSTPNRSARCRRL